MRCIYFSGEECEAAPPFPRFNYKPNEQEKKDICESNKFYECPRLRAFIDYMKAISKQTH